VLLLKIGSSLRVCYDCSFYFLDPCAVYCVQLLAIFPEMKGRYGSNTLPLHEGGCLGRGVADALEKCDAWILVAQFDVLGKNHLARPAPSRRVVYYDKLIPRRTDDAVKAARYR